MTVQVILREWDEQEVELSLPAVTELRERHGAKFQVFPSWQTAGRYLVRPLGVAGSVSLPGCQLLIEPKVELDVAVHMLGEVLGAGGSLPTLGSGEADHHHTAVTAAVAAWFSRLTLPVVERHLRRRYQLHEADLVAVRGKIEVAPSIRTIFRTFPPQQRCSFDEFTADTLENRMLRAASVILSGRPGLTRGTSAELRRIDHALYDVHLTIPPRWERDRRVPDRAARDYEPPLALAEWVLERASPELGNPQTPRPFQTFLIEMHSIFESYVAARLSAALSTVGWRANAQVAERLDPSGALFETRPDILVTSPTGQRTILDTKYKAFDESFRPSESDVYQMITYCVTRGATTGYLVYPERHAGQVPRRYTIAGSGTTLWAWPIVLGHSVANLRSSVDALAAALVDAKT